MHVNHRNDTNNCKAITKGTTVTAHLFNIPCSRTVCPYLGAVPCFGLDTPPSSSQYSVLKEGKSEIHMDDSI